MTVGYQLHQARTERKLSFADVSRETKIQSWVLEALEGDRLHTTMSPVYVKGFLATYAKFLRVPPEPLVAQLFPPAASPETELAATTPATSAIPSVMQWRMPQMPPAVRKRLVGAFAVSVAVAGLIIINPLRLLSKVELPSIKLPKLASVAQVKEPSKPAAPPTLQSVPLLSAQPLELVIKAHSTTWIQVKADGKLLTQQRLLRGANERWSAKKRFEIIVAKPSQVELSLNGQPISPFALAHQGRLLITHNGVTRLPDTQ